MVSEYYYNKMWQWQNNPGYRDYSDYVLRNRANLKNEFQGDPAFKAVCQFLHNYENNQVKNAGEVIIKGVLDPDQDIVNILVSATLEACGYQNAANSLLGLAVAGIIGAAAISIIAGILSNKE